eukprot:6087084-Pleurochrysis_carterae.AAC.2
MAVLPPPSAPITFPPRPPSSLPNQGLVDSLITVSPGLFPGDISWALACTDGANFSGGAPFSSPVTATAGSECTLT